MKAAVFLAAAAAGSSGTSSTPRPAAKAVVERLQGGESYMGNDGDAFVEDGTLHAPSIALLAAALQKSAGDPRNELAHALVGAARAHDKTREVILDPAVVKALVDTAVAKQDPAKEVCLDALLEYVPPAMLAPHGEALAKNLVDSPDETTVRVLTKAKPKGAGAALEKASKASESLAKTRSATLLRAAMGDKEVEKVLLEEFAGQKDGSKKARLAKELVLVGTPAALKAVAGEMRSAFVYETPSSIQRSFRLDVMEALLVAFPEEPAFYPNRILSDAEYMAAEAAAEKRTGVKLTAPRPDFLTSHGRPF